MSDLVKTTVTLVQPAKIGDVIRQIGWEGEVEADIHDQLAGAGAIMIVDGTQAFVEMQANLPQSFDQAAFDAAVAEQAQLLAGQAFDGALGKLEDELKQIVSQAEKETAEKDAALMRASEAEAKAAELAEKLSVAEAEIATLKAPAPTKTAKAT